MAGLRYTICDVFTDRPLTGNQLAVFTRADQIASELMQPLAREINFAETVYVLPAEGDGDFTIRIFTPALELPFAGHPTLGTAWVLSIEHDLDQVTLETGVGPVPVRVEREDGRPTFALMDQVVPSVAPYPDPDELLASLGVPRSLLPVEVYDNGVRHAFLCVPSPADVAAVRPDLSRLGALPGPIGVSCFAVDGHAVKTRMFGPTLGVPEDAATGSAAGPLAVHLVRHGRVGAGEEIVISQGAELGRPSVLRARASGSPEAIAQVQVGGQAVVVGSGEFKLP